MMKLNRTLINISKSSISEFNNYLKTIPNIKLLTYGEPYLSPNKEIKNELIKYILEDNDHYISSSGLVDIKNAIAEHEYKKAGIKYSNDEIILTNGSTEALFLAFSTIINPNDDVVLFSPFYPEYESLIELCGANKKVVKLDELYQINKLELQKKLSNKTKLLVINNPNNPTGVILNEKSIETIYFLMKKYNFYVLLDNVYDEIIFDKIFYLRKYKEIKERLLICNSLSKSHRLTGWRLGYLIANKEIINNACKLKSMMNICLPSILVNVVKFAINQQVEIEVYEKNIKYATKKLEKMNIHFVKPNGGFYIFFNIERFNLNSIDFCKKAAEEYQLGLLPGTFFNQENYVRLSCSCSFKTLTNALKSLNKMINNIKKSK